MSSPTEVSEFDVVSPQVLDTLERASIDMQIATARKFGRDPVTVIKKIMTLATMDVDTAASCFYSLKRWDAKEQKNKLIPGPSVRLAEIALYCFGNTRSGARVVDNDGTVVTSQGFAHDLESNNLVALNVQRRITNKDGKTFSEDMQVVTGNAAAAIAWRNAVLKVIPRSWYMPAYEQARKVAVGDATTLNDRRTKVVQRFGAMGVSLEQILAKVEKRHINDIGLEELEVLIGVGTSIKDGNSTVDEEFEPIVDPRAAGRAGVESLLKIGNLEAAKKMAADLKVDFESVKAEFDKKQPTKQAKEQPRDDETATVDTGGGATTAKAESSVPTEAPTAEPSGKAPASSAPEKKAEPEAKAEAKPDPKQDTRAFAELKLKDLRDKAGGKAFFDVLGSFGCEDLAMAAESGKYDEIVAALEQAIADKARTKKNSLKGME